MACSLRQRLLRDIAEIQVDPYPRITLHVNDNLTQACLVLSPDGHEPLHLTMHFGNYPLQAPVVKIQSKVCHPNVFGDYICASILNTTAGYTPAYTLKSIAIQLLSFFSSESLEQDQGMGEINLERYRYARSHELSSHYCMSCGFDDETRRKEKLARRIEDYCSFVSATTSTPIKDEDALCPTKTPNDSSVSLQGAAEASEQRDTGEMELDESAGSIIPVSDNSPSIVNLGQRFLALSDEVLLMILSELSDHDLWAVAKVFPVINQILYSYDFIRLHELQCFCLKETFMKVRLGVGVHRRRKQLQSRFPKLLDPRFGKGRRILFCPLPPAALPSHRDTCNCTYRKRNHPQLPRGQYVQVVLSQPRPSSRRRSYQRYWDDRAAPSCNNQGSSPP